MQNNEKTFLALSLVVFLIAFSAVPSLANGKKQHQADESMPMSKHMQEMYALKEKIPEDYQLMERTPIIPDQDSLLKGEAQYKQNCAMCHGSKGNGEGSAASALSTPPANFLDKKHSDIYGPGEKFWIIGNGSEKTGMPGFAHIDLIDRWHLVNYILHLQQESYVDTKDHKHH